MWGRSKVQVGKLVWRRLETQEPQVLQHEARRCELCASLTVLSGAEEPRSSERHRAHGHDGKVHVSRKRGISMLQGAIPALWVDSQLSPGAMG